MFSALTIIAQIVLPLILLVWASFGRERSIASWAIKTVGVALYLVTIALAGVWPLDPWLVPGLFIALLLVASARSFRRVRTELLWPASTRAWVAGGTRAMLASLTVVLALQVIGGRRVPSLPVVELAFPLAGGRFHVLNGGSSEIINAHLMTLTGDRFRKWRGQSHAVDLVELTGGVRARGVRPVDPRQYFIFGERVFAPCTGTVIAAVDGLHDLSPPDVDREHMAGNHVIVACNGVWVVLGHLQQGSVCVAIGDSVAPGVEVGRVGNSGNSDEPHLHIHAQRPGTADEPIGGEPLVMRFDGRYLVRNMVITGARRRSPAVEGR
jgi:hypothetical protein